MLYFHSSFVKSKYLLSTVLKHIPSPFLKCDRYNTKDIHNFVGLHLNLYYLKLGISEHKRYFHLSVSKLVSPEPLLRFLTLKRSLFVGSTQIQICRRYT